jgi:hypothetical protein
MKMQNDNPKIKNSKNGTLGRKNRKSECVGRVLFEKTKPIWLRVKMT